MKHVLLATCGLLFFTLANAAFDSNTGLRVSDFDESVSADVPGAISVGSAEAEALWQAGAVFLDATPLAYLGAGPPWPPEAVRGGIPGSNWLPNVGLGAMDAEQTRYLSQAMVQLTAGNQWAPVVVYCQDRCWDGWNAARRLVLQGYMSIFWYGPGVDGWKAEGLPWQPVRPVALP